MFLATQPQLTSWLYSIGPLILMIFFGMLIFGYGYVYLFVPETRGLSLEEVNFVFLFLLIVIC